ncbi:hypothetical protein [Dongshaea marina]|uniref:hypothetical protein n=1 Tax=Dongshaea marina TaxID=2047966 RepID=UPI0019014A0E|nr:hypothetical protein [Dongshaea marina]
MYHVYLNDVKNLLVLRGLDASSSNVQSTAMGILGRRIATQAEIMAFNDLFLILGG